MNTWGDGQSIKVPTLGQVTKLENWGEYLLADTDMGETFLVDILSQTCRLIDRAHLSPAASFDTAKEEERR